MAEGTNAYPLSWPEGWPQTAPHARENGKYRFKKGDYRGGYKQPSIDSACQRLMDELRKLGAINVVISSDLILRRDGLPRSEQRVPDNPGVAVYFDLGGQQKAMARDAFTRPEHNLTSLALAVEGMRQLDRHGGRAAAAKAFAGFDALPAPGAAASSNWRAVLNLDHTATRSDINQRYRTLARERHPDHGGSDLAMAELNAAREAALREIQK